MRTRLRTPMVAVAAALTAVAVGAAITPASVSVPRPAATASSLAQPQKAPSKPKRVLKPKKGVARASTLEQAASAAASPPADRLAVFRGLGAWVDLYDMKVDPRSAVRLLARNGVRTIYIQTARANTRYAIHPGVGRWIVEAHRAGLQIVGWYLPMYKNPARDLRRTVAIARYRYAGHRFDAAGIDIEYRAAVKSLRRWNRRVAANAAAVRRALGPRYPLAGIPPTPLQMRVAPDHWAGFPWRSLARSTDATLLMSYWSDRRGCPRIRRHCAYDFTRLNVEMTRRLQGSSQLIHVIGGIGDRISAAQLRAFVRGAVDGKAQGASLYDLVTTRRSWWPALRRLRTLR